MAFVRRSKVANFAVEKVGLWHLGVTASVGRKRVQGAVKEWDEVKVCSTMGLILIQHEDFSTPSRSMGQPR